MFSCTDSTEGPPETCLSLLCLSFGALPSTTVAVRNSAPVRSSTAIRTLGQAVRARAVVGRAVWEIFSIQVLKHVQKLRKEKRALIQGLSRTQG